MGTSQRRTLLHIGGEVVREPMFGLLLGAGGIYAVMGDMREALVLLGFVVIIMAVTVLQERRTGRALDALRDLSSPRALAVDKTGTLTLNRMAVALLPVVLALLVALFLATSVPAVAALFSFTALLRPMWLGCVAAGLVMALPYELARRSLDADDTRRAGYGLHRGG